MVTSHGQRSVGSPKPSVLPYQRQMVSSKRRERSFFAARASKSHIFAFSGKDQRGTTVVEFAIVASLFLMLTLGLIDLGRGVWIYNTLAHAARDGARYAIVHGSRSNNPATPETITDIVKGRSTLQNVVVTPSWDPDNNQGSAVQVTAQYDFQPLLPVLLGIDHIPLSATARMVISY